MTVIALHSTMAGCDGATRGKPDFGSIGRAPSFKVSTPRSTKRPPFRYSGKPVISSIPTNRHLSFFSRTSTRLYVSHIVSLWNGTRLLLSSSVVLLISSVGQGQTSPSETPPNERRDGQIGLSPSMRANHRAEIGAVRTPSGSIFD
jgi:hypothetical protein